MSDVNAFQFSARNWDSVHSDLNDVLCTPSDHFFILVHSLTENSFPLIDSAVSENSSSSQQRTND